MKLIHMEIEEEKLWGEILDIIVMEVVIFLMELIKAQRFGFVLLAAA